MSWLAFGALMLATVAWTTLPLLPALRELFAPTDVDPLRMVGRDNADISRFARNFRSYVEANLKRLAPEAASGDYFGRLPDGTHFVRVARDPGVLQRGAVSDGSHDRVVILEHPTTLEGGERFRLEIWARDGFEGGANAEYRALLGERSVRLGPGSVVWRWVHSSATLTADDGCALFGRASSDQAIRLGRDVGFERIGAPLITVGQGSPPSRPSPTIDAIPLTPPIDAVVRGDHLRVAGDLVVPPGSRWEGNLVIAGQLTVGAGSHLVGAVKAHGEIRLERGAVVDGSLVSRASIHVGDGCWVKGPVISEEEVTLGRGAGIGSPAVGTTLSGRSVVLGAGSTLCGHIVASAGGRTTP